MLWSSGLSFIGVFFAVPLRKQTIIKEQLKFPSGTATAQMISLLHDLPDVTTSPNTTLRRRRVFLEPDESHELSDIQDMSPIESSDQISRNKAWSLKLGALLASFSVSSVYTLTSYFFPIIYALPIFNWMTLNYVDFKAWEWYFTPSLSYIGQGIIMVRCYNYFFFVMWFKFSLLYLIGTSYYTFHASWSYCWMGYTIAISTLLRLGTRTDW